MKRVRIWLKENGGQYIEHQCLNPTGGQRECSGGDIDKGTLTVELDSKKSIIFSWVDPQHDGLVMASHDHVFHVNPNGSGSYGHRIKADNLSVEKVTFKLGNHAQEFSRPAEGQIFVKLCTSLASGHCTDDPN